MTAPEACAHAVTNGEAIVESVKLITGAALFGFIAWLFLR